MDGPTIAVVAIVSGVIYAMYEAWLKHKEKQPAQQQDKVYLAEIEDLKQRVAVLERIVTDKDNQLRREFEGL